VILSTFVVGQGTLLVSALSQVNSRDPSSSSVQPQPHDTSWEFFRVYPEDDLVVGRVLKLAFHDADTDPDTDFMRGKLRLLSWNIGVKSLGVRPQGRVWGF